MLDTLKAARKKTEQLQPHQISLLDLVIGSLDFAFSQRYTSLLEFLADTAALGVKGGLLKKGVGLAARLPAAVAVRSAIRAGAALPEVLELVFGVLGSPEDIKELGKRYEKAIEKLEGSEAGLTEIQRAAVGGTDAMIALGDLISEIISAAQGDALAGVSTAAKLPRTIDKLMVALDAIYRLILTSEILPEIEDTREKLRKTKDPHARRLLQERLRQLQRRREELRVRPEPPPTAPKRAETDAERALRQVRDHFQRPADPGPPPPEAITDRPGPGKRPPTPPPPAPFIQETIIDPLSGAIIRTPATRAMARAAMVTTTIKAPPRHLQSILSELKKLKRGFELLFGGRRRRFREARRDGDGGDGGGVVPGPPEPPLEPL